MRIVPMIALKLTLVLSAPLATGAQHVESPQKEPVIRDDFATDTRNDYQITGDTQWAAGQLSLAAGAAIARELAGGPAVAVDLSLNAIPLSASTALTDIRVWTLRPGATDCYLSIRSAAGNEDGHVSVSFVELTEQDGRTTEQVVREAVVSDFDLRRLRMDWRYGLVRLQSASAVVFAAHVGNDNAPIAAIRIAAESPVQLERLQITTDRLEVREYSDAEIEQLNAANDADQRLIASYRAQDFSEAVEHGLESLRLREPILGKRHPDYATSLSNLAVMYHSQGDFAKAVPLYRQALQVEAIVLGDQHPDYATSLHNLGTMYSRMGDHANAEASFQQALSIRKLVLGERDPDYASTLNSLGLLYEATQDYARAEPLYKEALDITREVLGSGHPNYASSLNNLAMLYDSMEDFARAEPLYVEAREIRKQVLGEQHPDYATCLNNLAVLYVKTGDFRRAETLYVQAREIWKSSLGDETTSYAISLNNLAKLYLLQGEYGRAATLTAEAVGIAERQLTAGSLAQSERQQKSFQRQERDFLDWHLTVSIESDADPHDVASVIWKWKGATTRRQRAYRQVASNSDLAPLFDALRSVSQQLSSLSNGIPVPPPAAATEESHRAYKVERSRWDAEFAALAREREELERQIASGSEVFRELREPLTVATVSTLLPSGTALVDFFEYEHATPDPRQTGRTIGQRRFLAIVVRSDGRASLIGLGAMKGIADSIQALRQSITAEAAIAGTAESAQQILRQQLWNPIERHLDGIDTVIVSPDTVLGTLPLAALPGRRPGSYLLEDYRLVSVPFAQLLRTLRDDLPDVTGQNNLLIVGGVDYDASERNETPSEQAGLLAYADEVTQYRKTRGAKGLRWESLSGFQQELNAVIALHREWFGAAADITRLSGTAATENAFLQRAGQYRMLHVITHGFFADPQVKSVEQQVTTSGAASGTSSQSDNLVRSWLPGLLSGLVFAGANNAARAPADPHDGILRAAEIEASSMRDVELVVLSACETGLGAVAGGEGLTGLQRAFHIAGADSVVASLWKVDDQATLELMQRFYRNLWQHKMSKVDALREAQLWMLLHPQELEQLGVSGASTRGLGGNSKQVTSTKTSEGAVVRTAPFFWAAFQLSGDWQ